MILKHVWGLLARTKVLILATLVGFVWSNSADLSQLVEFIGKRVGVLVNYLAS